MEATYFYLTLTVGLCISLLCEEIFGVRCGGMTVPGYLAFVCDDIPQMLLIFTVSMVVYAIIEYVLPKFVILYGKRKFVAAMTVSIILKLALDCIFPYVPFTSVIFRGFGAVSPALVARSCSEQGFRYTIPAVLISTYLTFAIVSLICWIV